MNLEYVICSKACSESATLLCHDLKSKVPGRGGNWTDMVDRTSRDYPAAYLWLWMTQNVVERPQWHSWKEAVHSPYSMTIGYTASRNFIVLGGLRTCKPINRSSVANESRTPIRITRYIIPCQMNHTCPLHIEQHGEVESECKVVLADPFSEGLAQ